MSEYRGSCHCGAVEFRVRADLEEERILKCNCSICRRKGFLHLIVPPGRFELVAGDARLRTYQFHTETAVHRFCERCGIHAFYTPRSHPEKVSVNVRCLEGVELDGLEVEPFDGKNWEETVDGIRD